MARDQTLSRIHALVEQKGSHIVHTRELSRSDRQWLVQHHWLEEIIRGWYLVVRPDLPPGDSTAWYANFWDFLATYLRYHYDSDYCLSAECSLDFHLGNPAIPKQVIVMAKSGSGSNLPLPYETSLLVYGDPSRLPQKRENIRGLQVMSLAYALCKVSPTYFERSPKEAEIALRSVSAPEELLHIIAEHPFKSAVGRLIGAYRFLGDLSMADSLKQSLAHIGIAPQETNPFISLTPLLPGEKAHSPYALRIYLMWEELRRVILPCFPRAPAATGYDAYLQQVTEIYAQDAYNSLSIEGYKVSKELIEKVKSNNWNPSGDPGDKEHQNALAARGYYEAFLGVKASIEKILQGDSPGHVIATDLSQWYQRLFAPSVHAGILSPGDLFGYRRHQVYIRNSRHTPPPQEYLGEAMEAFFTSLKREEHPGVRALLGHFIFVYIHPYMDGNGRLGRFIMNAMLASGGYPWTIVHTAHRTAYLTALESASINNDILPFTQFIVDEMSNE